jgi:hypothetical protein
MRPLTSAVGLIRNSRSRETIQRLWINSRVMRSIERGAGLQVVSSTLARCRHQARILNPDAWGSRAQAGRIEIRPDLVGAVSTDGRDGKLAGVARGKRFVRLHVRSKHRKGNHGHSEERENRERSEIFDHLGLLTVAGTPIPQHSGIDRQHRRRRQVPRIPALIWMPLTGIRGNLRSIRGGPSAGGHAEAAMHRTPLGGWAWRPVVPG